MSAKSAAVDVESLIDVKNGTQQKRIFWDQEIYDLELERIFGKCWQFLTHDSLIPNPGDFTTGHMAEDEILIVRLQNIEREARPGHRSRKIEQQVLSRRDVGPDETGYGRYSGYLHAGIGY